MHFAVFTALAAAAVIAPVAAIPPPDFGFPEAPNDTALVAAFRQDSGSVGYVPLAEAELFGIQVPANEPVVGVNTSAYTSLSNYSGDYLVMMVDPDARFPENPTLRFILHWMQPNMSQSTTADVMVDANLTLTGSRQLVNTSDPVVPYLRPMPPTNSSAHRYILYAFQQPANFSVPATFAGYNATNRTNFNLTQFVADAGLGSPAAANYFYCSNESVVPGDFVAAAGGSYPGGNGDIVTSGDPYKPTASAMASGSGSGSSATGGSASSTSSKGFAAKVTGVGSLVGAGLVGLAALM